MRHLQFVAVLPYIIQADDVWVLQQLHHRDLSFESIWDGFVTRSAAGDDSFGALDQIGQTLGTCTLRSGACDDLDGAILMSSLMPDHAHSRAATLSNRLAQLPVADVCFASAARCVCGSSRNG